jgi:very-short-patch-repair endonuclease
MTGWAKGMQVMVAGGGLARRDELAALGISDRTLRRRVATGLLVPVNPKVVALPGTELDLVAMTRAAVLARPDLTPTGLSAAALLGTGPWDAVPLVGDPWLVGRPSRTLRARYVSHPGLRTTWRQGVLTATPAEAVVDLLRHLDLTVAIQVGRAALQQRVVTLDQLVSAHERLTGLHGVRQLATVIKDLAEGTHSDGEHRLVGLLREAGITGWRPNHCVLIGPKRYFLDIAFPAARLAIEVDGRAYHSDARSFQRDRRRQNDLVAAGWTVLRFTWEDVVLRPDDVIARIEAALRRAIAS